MRNFTIVNPFPPSYIRAQRDLRRALPLLAAVILAALAATLNAAGPPSAPTGFRLVAREARLGVVWRAPDQPNGVISRYVVEYRQGDTGGWTALHITPGASCDQQNRCSTEISGLTGGQLYQVRVAADNGQVGAYAGPESAAPLAANPPPTATPTPSPTPTLPPTATPTPVGEDTAGPSPTPPPPTAAPTLPPTATAAPVEEDAAGPPSAPTGFRLVAREARLGVVWRAPDQPNGVISRYVVEYRQGDTGGWTALHITPGASCDQQNRCSTEISGLTGGQLYQVRVAADNGQVGAYAGPESAAPLAANPPPTATPTPSPTPTLPPTATPTPVGEDTAGPSPTPLPPTAAPTLPPTATPTPTATPPPTAKQEAVNRPPTASAGAAQTVEEGTAVTLNGSASSDPDGDKLTYAWLQLSGTTVSLSSATAASPTFMAPQLLQNEALVFQLIVNDGAASSAPATVTVTVEADNDAPILGVSAAPTVAAGETVTLSGLATDPEGQTVTWLWSQTNATPAVTLHNAKTATASFTAPANLAADATLTFMLTVSDGVNTATATVQVIVRKTAAPAAASQQAAGQQAVSPGLRLSTASLTVDEGSGGFFTVRLNTEPPPGFVVINIHLNPGGVLRLQSARQLVFAPTNWNHEWTVTVEALPDVDTAPDRATISFSMDSSSTAAYRIVDIPDVDVTVNDTGAATAAVIVNPTTLTVQEGSFAGYTLVLGARPSANVTINITEGSPAIVTSPNSNPDSESLTLVTFTPENWHKPRVVFVNGRQDDNPVGETATITHTVKKTSSAPEYADVNVSAVNVTVEDNDRTDGTPGVSFVSARPPILVCEPSPYDSPNSPPCLGYYEIVLNKKPTTRVVIRITSGDADRVQVSTDTYTTWSNTVDMTFTPKNWNVDWKHGVYLKGLADDDCISETVTITHAVVDDQSADEYDILSDKLLTAEMYDSDYDCSG
ncbi:MAG: fibronectin type III domain-containing protein [Caldilineaceae bacterium]|nr:fibronectin type III domain-containing protein [Caldilineaceae bacterium]